MNVDEVMNKLKALGTEKTRSVNARNGAPEPHFGVSWADLNKLKKEIGVNQQLAEELWATGNSDARALGVLIADPKGITREVVDSWIETTEYNLLTAVIARELAPRTPFAYQMAKEWLESPRDVTHASGWTILIGLMEKGSGKGGLTGEEIRSYIDRIEQGIHQAPWRTREMMNLALLMAAKTHRELLEYAAAAAERIGEVQFDPKQNVCRTPDVMTYFKNRRGVMVGD